MNTLQQVIEEMEADFSSAKSDVSSNEFDAIAKGEIIALEKYIPKLKLLLNAETQTTVKKPEA